MKIRFLLDTCILSEPVKPRPSVAVLDFLIRNDSRMAMPAIVWHELLFGAGRLAAGRRRDRLQAWLREVVAPGFPVLPYDVDAARLHAEFRTALERQGRSLSFADGQIAAIALVHELVLVTRNLADFAGIPGLRVVDPWQGLDSTQDNV